MQKRREPHHLQRAGDEDVETVFGAAHSTSLEEMLIAMLVYKPSRVSDIAGELDPDHFIDHMLGRAYAFIRRQAAAGRQVTLGLLISALETHPWFAERGGGGYLSDLVDGYFHLDKQSETSPLECARQITDLWLKRETILACRDIMASARTDFELSGDELMGQLEQRVMSARTGGGAADLREFGDVLDRVVDRIDHPESAPLLKTGFSRIDRITGGHEPGELVLIGGRPGMGKSALASCIALQMAGSGSGVVELNGEMTEEQMARRKITDLLHLMYDRGAPTYAQIRRRELTDDQIEKVRWAAAELKSRPIRMLKRTGMTIPMVRSMLKRQKSMWAAEGIPMRAVFIDHVGLVRPAGFSRSRYEAQTEISMAMKELADELEVTMFGLAQLSREIERRDDKRPQLGDFRDSGSWEQDADIVIGAYRDSYYAHREPKPKNPVDVADWELRRADVSMEAILLKVREGEGGRTASLWTDIGRNAIRDEAPPIPADF